MAVVRSNFADLLAVGFRKMVFEEYSRYPEEYSQYYNVESSSRAFEEEAGQVGLGLVPEKAEGAAIQYDDPAQGYKKRFDHRAFALGFQITHEMMQDDQYRIMSRMPSQLGKSLRYTIELEGAKLLNEAASVANSENVGQDGLALASAAHTSVLSGTQSNTAAVVLSETSVEDNLLAIESQLDDRGLLIQQRATSMIVPPEMAFRAARVMNTSTMPGVGGSDLAVATAGTGGSNMQNYAFAPVEANPIRGRLSVTVGRHLTDSNNWFVRTDNIHSFWFWREQPVFDKDNQFDTKNARFSVYARWGRGFADWRGWYANIVA